MSFYVYLNCQCCGQEIAEEKYTSNTNAMCNAALAAAVPSMAGRHWLDELDGMNREPGVALLLHIVTELEREHATYDAMNPTNGWGSRAGIVETIRKMLARVSQPPLGPAVWKVSR